jgi:hypothetical protein
MNITRTLVGFLCLFLAVARPASAVTIDQIVAMSKAGVSDAVIVAMIERDKAVFTLDPLQVVELQQAGVSDRVTVAMIQTDTARTPSTLVASEQPGAVATEQPNTAPYPGAVAYPGAVVYPSVVTYPGAVAYAVPFAVPHRARRSHAVMTTPLVVQPPLINTTPLTPAAQAVTPARGMFFSQPAAGIFFPPPAADPQPPPARPHRR